MAGAVFLLSRGQIATTAPAKQEDYEAFAREVMAEVRAGRAVPRAVDPVIDVLLKDLAPESVRQPGGGALTFEFIGPTEPGAGLPHIQSVVVRAPDGEGVSIAISILGGRAEVVGLASVDPLAKEPKP